jgi:hypothetical protein
MQTYAPMLNHPVSSVTLIKQILRGEASEKYRLESIYNVGRPDIGPDSRTTSRVHSRLVSMAQHGTTFGAASRVDCFLYRLGRVAAQRQ